MSAGGPRKAWKGEVAVVLAIFLLAWVIRVWGLKFGLPFPEARPDELPMAHRALRMFSGDLNPHHFAYGTLFPYLLALCYGAWFAIRMVLGTGLDAIVTELALDTTPLLMISRHLSALMGAATVVPVYLIGRRTGGRSVGTMAALFCAVALLHVRDSHFGVTDVPMTFFITTGLWLILRLRDHDQIRDYLLAGIAAGLAVSVKYAGVFLLAPLMVAQLAWRRRAGASWREVLVYPGPTWFVLGLIGAFVATTPYSVLDYTAFLDHFLFETVDHLATGHGLDLGRGWVYHATITLPRGLGLLLFGAALAGIANGLRTRTPALLVLIAFVAAYYGVAGSGRTVFFRYMIPLVPVLCVLAAEAVGRLRGRNAWIAAVVIAFPTLLASARYDAGLAATDSRVIAREWIEANVDAGSQIGQLGFPSLQVHLAETLTGLEARIAQTEAEGGSGRLLRAELEARRAGLGVVGYELNDLEATASALPDYLIVPRVPLVLYSSLPEGWEARLDEEYELIHSVPGVGSPGDSVLFDPLDAFLYPMRGGDQITRPGPNVEVYRRITPR